MRPLPRRRAFAPAALVVVAGALASGCAFTWQELSPELPQVAQSSVVLAADGTPILTLHAEENRSNAAYEDIPAQLVDAVVAIEDERFWLHRGVDFRAIVRAVQVNASSGEVAQGGSTITQQLVKLLLLSSDQTLDRKVAEAALAWQLEERYTKERILELYLNTVYFGSGAYGVVAAADEFFGKPLAELTVAESALLAGLINSPGSYDVRNEPEPALERRDLVLDAMFDQGLIDEAAHTAALAEPLTLAADVPVLDQRYPAAHFVEEVKQFILRDPRFGATFEERRDLLFTGGITINTTIDLSLQAAAEAAVAEVLPDPGADPEAAVVSIDPSNGHVLAMVGGRDYFGTHPTAKFNLAMGQGRHPGSAFKPLVLAAALQSGLVDLDTAFDAPGEMVLTYGDPPQAWDVGNYGEGGPGVPVDLRESTVRSYNTVYAQLILRIGTDRAIDTAQAMGIDGDLDRFPSAVLGANDVQPLEMAEAYATLANRGVHVEPVMVTSVVRADGTILYESEHRQERVLDPYVADQVTDVLVDAVDRGTGTAAQLDRPVAGKTGTAQGWRNAMFCGYVPQLATAVWVGYPGEEQFSMVPPRTPIRVTGGSYPAEIWQRFMAAATTGMPVEEFAEPTPPPTTPPLPPLPADPSAPVLGPAAEVPDVSGLPLLEAWSALSEAGFTIQYVIDDASPAPAPTVLRQSPAPGTMVGTNGIVTLVVSQLPAAADSGLDGEAPTTTVAPP